jgi:hypothetical protein
MQGEPRYDFPVVSERAVRPLGPSLDEAGFGNVVLDGDTVFEDLGGDAWKDREWGKQIGTLTLVQVPTIVAGRVTVEATFVFDDGDQVTYKGLVPGNGSWKGRGRFGFVTGTGKFADRGGEIGVESTNPKHWG